jgi:hypothetical protein
MVNRMGTTQNRLALSSKKFDMLNRVIRDDTEHGVEYYQANEVDDTIKSNAAWALMCEQMVAHERNECAKIASGWARQYDDVAAAIARAIKARGNK